MMTMGGIQLISLHRNSCSRIKMIIESVNAGSDELHVVFFLHKLRTLRYACRRYDDLHDIMVDLIGDQN